MTLEQLLSDYQRLPEFVGIELRDARQISAFGDRPINIAATRGSIEELEVLLAHGADVDSAGEHGYTPLHNAVEQGMLGAVTWLLRHGANKEVRNSLGDSPRELAVVLGEMEISGLLE